MHGVDIYDIKDFFQSLGSDKFSYGNKRLDLATRQLSARLSYTLYEINSQLSQGEGCWLLHVSDDRLNYN